jgi:uncharacterized repeat protein (TIGR02543 family)
MSIRVKTSEAGSGIWNDITKLLLKTSEAGTGIWKNITKAYVKDSNGIWKIFFGKPGPQIDQTPEISAAGSVHPETLTGTNYHWDSGNVFSYIFQKALTNSSNNDDWSDIGSYATITNPAEGLSNTKTYTTQDADFDTTKKSMWFRFVVKAVNTVSNETTIEPSNGLEIKIKPFNTVAPIATPSSGTSGVTTFSVTTGDWNYAPTTYTYLWKYKSNTSTWSAATGNNSSNTYLPPENYFAVYGPDLKCTVVASNGIDSVEVDSNQVTILGGERTVNWNGNGGSVSPSSSTGYAPNYTVTTPTPTRSGYSFNGWYNTSASDYTYGPIGAGTSWNIPSGVTTMYARWTLISPPSNISAPTISPSSGTEGSTTFSVTNVGSWNNSPTSYGYQWVYNNGSFGWSAISGATSSSYSPSVGYVSTYGSSLACYVTAYNAGGGSSPALSNQASVSASNRTVYWDANGGSVSPSSSTASSPWNVSAPTPTRSGYTLVGWRDTTSGDYTYGVAAGGSFTIPYNGITMYARWTLNANPPSGGSVSLSGSGVAGTTITATTSGWSDSPTTYSVRILAGVDGVNYPITKATNSPTSSNTVSYTVTTSDAASPPYIFIARATATNAYGTSSQVESSTITSSPAGGPFFPPFFPPSFPFFPSFACTPGEICRTEFNGPCIDFYVYDSNCNCVYASTFC